MLDKLDNDPHCPRQRIAKKMKKRKVMQKLIYYSGLLHEEIEVLLIQQSGRLLAPFPCPLLFEQPTVVIYERLLPVYSRPAENTHLQRFSRGFFGPLVAGTF